MELAGQRGIRVALWCQAVAQGELGECWQGGEMAAGPDKVYRKSQCGGEGPSVRIFLTVFGPFPQ